MVCVCIYIYIYVIWLSTIYDLDSPLVHKNLYRPWFWYTFWGNTRLFKKHVETSTFLFRAHFSRFPSVFAWHDYFDQFGLWAAEEMLGVPCCCVHELKKQKKNLHQSMCQTVLWIERWWVEASLSITCLHKGSRASFENMPRVPWFLDLCLGPSYRTHIMWCDAHLQPVCEEVLPSLILFFRATVSFLQFCGMVHLAHCSGNKSQLTPEVFRRGMGLHDAEVIVCLC